MPKRPARYSKAKSVKAIARERVGTPPPSRPLIDKAHRTRLKHKKAMQPED